MGHPGRPRRKNKVQPVIIQQEVPPPARQRVVLKEEPTAQLHDEADLVTFRADTLKRFIRNQEFLENVVSKHIHMSKIIPPRIFPVVDKSFSSDEELQKFIKGMQVDELYFGNRAVMEAKNKQIEDEVRKLAEEETIYSLKSEMHEFKKNSIERLTTLQAEIHDVDSLSKFEEELEHTIREYKTKHNKIFKSTSRFERLSIPFDQISEGKIQVEFAPADYDPRKIASNFLNDSMENNSPNTAPLNENTRAASHSLEQSREKHDSSVVAEPFSMDLMSGTASSMVSLPSKVGSSSDPNLHENSSTEKLDIDDRNSENIDDLFNEDLADSENIDVADPLNELLDFSNSENNMVLPVSNFQSEFLDQIEDNM